MKRWWGVGSVKSTTDSGIAVTLEAEDIPEFERTYTKQLSPRAHVKVRIHYFLNSRMEHGELTQPNGRWVIFEPSRVADKILDPQLVPLIESFVAEVYRMDTAFRENDVEYTDAKGRKWRMVKP